MGMGETHININGSSTNCLCILLIILIFHLSFPLRCSGDATLTKERTLAMIKPDGLVGNHTNFIQNTILASGFTILNQITLQLDQDTAKGFYAEHSSRTFFPNLINYITSGPVLIMVLEKVNAVSDWRSLIGPTDASKAKVTHPHSIRAMCGVNLERNCVHGSDSIKSAAREISFFFKKTNSGQTVDRCFNSYNVVYVVKMFQNMMNFKLSIVNIQGAKICHAKASPDMQITKRNGKFHLGLGAS